MMVLYHGSQYRIEKPVFGGGRAANDYGRGFYCTESESLACEWAVSEKHVGTGRPFTISWSMRIK